MADTSTVGMDIDTKPAEDSLESLAATSKSSLASIKKDIDETRGKVKNLVTDEDRARWQSNMNRVRAGFDDVRTTTEQLVAVQKRWAEEANKISSVIQPSIISAGELEEAVRKYDSMVAQSGDTTKKAVTAATRAFDAAKAAITENVKEMNRVFEQEMLSIKEAMARGWISPKEAKEAGRETALAFNEGMMSQLDHLASYGKNMGNSEMYRELSASLKEVALATNQVTDSTRQMTMLQEQAIEMDRLRDAQLKYNARDLSLVEAEAVKMNEKIDSSSKMGAAGLGRLRFGLMSLVASATGTIPVVDRLVGSFMFMGMESGVMIAVLAGLAALALAWKYATGPAQELKKKQDELSQSLINWYKAQNEGNGAQKMLEQIDAMNHRLPDLKKNLDNLSSGSGWITFTKSFQTFLGSFLFTKNFFTGNIEDFNKEWAKVIAAQKQTVIDGAAAVAKAGQQAYFDEFNSMFDKVSQRVSSLVTLIGNKMASSAQLKTAQNMVSELQKTFREWNKSAENAATQEQRDYALGMAAKISGMIKSIQGALNDTSIPDKIKAIADAIAKMNAEANKSSDPTAVAHLGVKTQFEGLSKDIDELAKKAGVASPVLQKLRMDLAAARRALDESIDTKALKDQQDAERALASAGRERNAQLRAQYEAIGLVGAALVKHNADAKLAADIMKAQNDLEKSTAPNRYLIYNLTVANAQSEHDWAVAIGLKTEALSKERNEASENFKIWSDIYKLNRQLAQQYKDDLAKGIANFAEHGIGSFQKFYDGVLAITVRLGASIDKMLQGVIDKMEEAFNNGEVSKGALDALQKMMEKLEAFKSALKLVGSAMAGGQVGYALGQQSPSAGSGAVNGALGGAAAGFATGGPWGAVVGGLAGLAGGLIGGAEAAKKRKEAEEQLRKALEQSMDQMRVQAGTMTELSAAMNNAHRQADVLRDQIDKAYSGTKNQTERERLLAEVRDDEAAIIQKLIDAEGKRRNDESKQAALDIASLAVRQLIAQGYEDEAAAMQDQLEVERALLEGRSAEYIAALQLTQALVRAAAEAQKANAAFFQMADAAYAATVAARNYAWQQYQQSITDVTNDPNLFSTALQKQTKAFTDVWQRQIDIARAQLKSQQDTQKTVAQSAKDTQKAFDALTKFKESLQIGPLSVLSPLEQKNAAAAAMNDLFAKAKAGDKEAAANFSGAAQTFLQLSQQYSASTLDYANDNANVQRMLDSLIAQYGQQASIEQQMLNASNTQIDLLQQQIDLAQRQIDRINYAADAVKAVGDKLFGGNGNTPQGVWDSVVFNALANALGGAPGGLTNGNPMAIGPSGLPYGNQTSTSSATIAERFVYAMMALMHQFQIPGFASGGMFSGGMRIVGENGPELEVTGASRIFSASETRSILSGGDDKSMEKQNELTMQLIGTVAQGNQDLRVSLDKTNARLDNISRQLRLQEQ